MKTLSRINAEHDNAFLVSMLEMYFARVKGWQKYATNRSGIIAYRENATQNALEAYLPLNLDIPSSKDLIQKAISLAAFLEGKQVNQMMQTLASPDKDLCDYKIESKSTSSVSALLVEQVLRTSLNSLKTYYTKEQSDYLKNLTKEAKRNLPNIAEYQTIFEKSCRFAHTWKGSFGITLIIPLGMSSLGLLSQTQPANEYRKACEKYLQCLRSINYGTDDHSVNYIVDNNTDKASKKVLRNLSFLHDSMKSSTVQISGRLSPLMQQVETTINYRQPAILNVTSIEYVTRALEELASKEEPIEDTFVGFPKVLSAGRRDLDPNSGMKDLLSDTEFGHRKVRVTGTGNKIGPATLNVELSGEQYDEALKAQTLQREGITCFIAMHCKVKKQSRGWEVLELLSFKLILGETDTSTLADKVQMEEPVLRQLLQGDGTGSNPKMIKGQE